MLFRVRPRGPVLFRVGSSDKLGSVPVSVVAIPDDSLCGQPWLTRASTVRFQFQAMSIRLNVPKRHSN